MRLDILKNYITINDKYYYEDILNALYSVTNAPASYDAEAVLYTVLISTNQVKVSEKSCLPGVMSPEDMLKSISIQCLFKWDIFPSRLECDKIRSTIHSPALIYIVNKLEIDNENTTTQ